MIKVDLICRVVTYSALAPLIGLVLKGVMLLTGASYVADFDMAGFFLSPVGVIGMSIVATVVIAVLAFDQVCLMTIAHASVTGQKPRVRVAIWTGIKNFFPAARLAGRLIVRSLLIALPFLAAAGLVFLLLLTEYDISFYLGEKPPAFLLACGLFGLIAGGMLYMLVPRLIAWSFVLPLVLFEAVSVSKAMAESRARTAGRKKALLRSLVFWFIGSVAVHFLLAELIVVGGRWVLGSLAGSEQLFFVVMALWIQLWFVFTYLISYMQAATFSLLIVRKYEESKSLRLEKQLGNDGLDSELNLPTKWISTRAILLLITLISVGFTVVGVSLLQSINFGDHAMVVAHRGDSGSAPENSLAAIENAIEAGVHWVEIDIQETLDGEVVVLHDSDLMRMAGVESKIWELTLEDLKHIDIGSSFSPEFADARVPKLEDVLRMCKGKVGVIIELKFNEKSKLLAERAIAIVEDLGMEDEIMFMSLAFDGVNIVYDLRPDWKAGLATGVKIGDLAAVEADFLAVKKPIATRRFVRAANAKGKEVYVWTVDDPREMHRFFSMGIDMIITNKPALAISILKERAEMGGAERLLLELALFLDVDLGE